MKKNVCLLLICSLLFVNIQSFAQFSYGAKLGLNLSSTSGKENSNDNTDYKSLAGVQIGGVLNYAVDENISLQAELAYSQKGWLEKEIYGNQNSTTRKRKFRLDYIEIPTLIKYSFNIPGEFKFYAIGGPYFGFVTGGRYKQTTTTNIGSTTITTTYKGKVKFKTEPDNYDGADWYFEPSEVSKTNVGVCLGGGVGKQIGPGTLFVDLRYGFGLTDFYQDDYFGSSDRPDGYKKFQDRTFSISLIYMLQ